MGSNTRRQARPNTGAAQIINYEDSLVATGSKHLFSSENLTPTEEGTSTEGPAYERAQKATKAAETDVFPASNIQDISATIREKMGFIWWQHSSLEHAQAFAEAKSSRNINQFKTTLQQIEDSLSKIPDSTTLKKDILQELQKQITNSPAQNELSHKESKQVSKIQKYIKPGSTPEHTILLIGKNEVEISAQDISALTVHLTQISEWLKETETDTSQLIDLLSKFKRLKIWSFRKKREILENIRAIVSRYPTSDIPQNKLAHKTFDLVTGTRWSQLTIIKDLQPLTENPALLTNGDTTATKLRIISEKLTSAT